MRPFSDWFEYKEALELRFLKLFNPFEGGNRKKISGSSDFRQKTSEQSVIVTALGLKCTLLLLTAYLGSEYPPLRSVREFRH